MTPSVETWIAADRIFSDLLELPPTERSGALWQLAPSPEVAHFVEQLLAAEDREEGVLDRPLAVARLIEQPASSLVGRQLGDWVLDEELGRGGMAVVYRAHRTAGDFDQAVAIKILALGLVPTAVERFRREQQVLARLEHPAIARILDGALAPDGTPFLVMELVRGQRIDHYCDQHHLGTSERVELMVLVCDAVAYAHRNLVVHRDIKPANILVDASGPKLLDFGIAKLLDPDTGDLTRHDDRLLTPAYAAPEQCTGAPITLATDVFSLGIVLDQLLRGATNTETPRPVDPQPRAARTDRDLTNIIAMATRAEPDRRYEDARALAEDLRAWREGRPVRATADTGWYRLHKWLGRHRGLAAATTMVGLALVAGGTATLLQAERAQREARTAATVSAFLADLFRSSDPASNAGEDLRASELLRRGAARARTNLAGDPLVEAELLHAIGTTQRDIGQHHDAELSLSEAVQLRTRLLGATHPDTAASRTELAWVRYEQGRLDESLVLLDQALADLEAAADPDDPRRLRAQLSLADMHVNAGNAASAVALLEDFVAEHAQRHDPKIRRDAQWTLGSAHGQLGNWDVALELLAAVVAEERRQPSGSQLVTYLNDYGIVAFDAGRYAVARQAFEEALPLGRTLHGTNHPKVASTLSNLGLALDALGEREAAIVVLQEGLEATVAAFGPDHPETARAHGALAVALRKADRFDLALHHFEASAAIWLRQTTTDHALAAGAFLTQYGGLVTELGDPQRGHDLLTLAEKNLRVELPADHHRVALAQTWLAIAELDLGAPDHALARLQAAVPVLEASLGRTHHNVTLGRVALVRVLEHLGQQDEATALAKQTLATLPPDADPGLATQLVRLADPTGPSSD